MSRSLFVRICLMASLGLVLTFSNCARPENIQFFKKLNTSTIGNPFAETTNKILSSSCTLIQACHPELMQEACLSGLLASSGFAAPLGLSSNYDTLGAIANAEASGLITAQSAQGDQCSQQISAQSCQLPSVQNAYNPMLADPFQNAAAVIPNGNCGMTYSVGVNLESPIELVDLGLASRPTTQVFARTRTSLDTQDYDGVVSYQFEIIAENSNSQVRSVALLDSIDQTVATISVPAQTIVPTRLRASFALPAGASDYRVQLQGTSPQEQLKVFAARIWVNQKNATRTKIYIPLVGSYATDTSRLDDSNSRIDMATGTSYAQNNPHYYALWKKRTAAFSDLAAQNPWTFEAVVGTASAGSTMYTQLFNATQSLPIPDSELSTTSQVPVLLSRSFANSALNFTDMSDVEVRIRRDAVGGSGVLYRAGLWVKLTNLSHTEIYHRLSSTIWRNSNAAVVYDSSLSSVDTAQFSAPLSTYHEGTGFVQSAGVPCSTQMMDIGINNAGNAGPRLSNSLLSFNATTKTLQRSPGLNIPNNHSMVIEVGANPQLDSCIVPQSLLVIGF